MYIQKKPTPSPIGKRRNVWDVVAYRKLKRIALERVDITCKPGNKNTKAIQEHDYAVSVHSLICITWTIKWGRCT